MRTSVELALAFPIHYRRNLKPAKQNIINVRNEAKVIKDTQPFVLFCHIFIFRVSIRYLLFLASETTKNGVAWKTAKLRHSHFYDPVLLQSS